jgi:hypothetical protein
MNSHHSAGMDSAPQVVKDAVELRQPKGRVNMDSFIAQIEERALKPPKVANKLAAYSHKFTSNNEGEIVKIVEREGIDEPSFISTISEFRDAVGKTLLTARDEDQTQDTV